MVFENEGLKGTFLKAAHLNGRLKIFSQLFQNMSSNPDFVFLFVENRQKNISIIPRIFKVANWLQFEVISCRSLIKGPDLTLFARALEGSPSTLLPRLLWECVVRLTSSCSISARKAQLAVLSPLELDCPKLLSCGDISPIPSNLWSQFSSTSTFLIFLNCFNFR